MTTDSVVQFLEQHPFEPFVITLVNGREHQVLHPENASVGEFALTILLTHPTGPLEVIDAAHIVSFRTVYASDGAS